MSKLHLQHQRSPDLNIKTVPNQDSRDLTFAKEDSADENPSPEETGQRKAKRGPPLQVGQESSLKAERGTLSPAVLKSEE